MLLETAFIMKMATLAGCGWGIYQTAYRFPIPAARKKLMKCFRLGGIFLREKKNKTESKTFPIIQHVNIEEDHMTLDFILPIGVDPDHVFDREWLFRQQFGEHITLVGNDMHFRLTVYQKEIEQFSYNYDEFKESMSEHLLPVIVGRSRKGVEVYDITKHPHLLIAGETGAGKSTQLRSIITGFIQHFSPNELQLYMADMKMAEFHIFKNIEHVKQNVNDVADLTEMLLEIDDEIEERGRILNEYEEAHISDIPQEKRPPWIVVCIDEVALISDEKPIMKKIQKIAQVGRALGIFLILSLQRPDAKTLDGAIKSCLTVRMGFRQADAINSRIVLDQAGAEAIVQKGMMLFKNERMEAVQGPLLEVDDAKKLLEPFKKKEKKSNVVPLVLGGLEDDDEA